MKIILSNNIELEPIDIIGSKRVVQGTGRDTLEFVFSSSEDLKNLDSIFNSNNCETITIIDGENNYIHKGYTIRAELCKKSVEVQPETVDSPAVYEEHIFVSMSQKTYMEACFEQTQAMLTSFLNK